VKGEPALRLPPFREFSLPRNSVVGWFFIFILSWVLRLTGFGAADIVSINVNLIFEFTFALQGISLVLFGCHMRKIPKAIPVILIIVLWVLTIGKTVLFVLGIADLLLNLRSKMLPR
ncbi:MAG: DUF2232 domain-containing protein, partial [Anaerovoracaceae bacterium]